MARKLLLMFAVTFTAGLLFVSIYNSLIDVPNWSSNIPVSIQTTRDYFKTANPGNFFRIFSPGDQLITLLALIFCWKVSKTLRLYCAAALLLAIGADVFTFAYFYPRNEILFELPISSNLNALKTASSQWASMNWVRSFICAIELYFDFSALALLLRNTDKKNEHYKISIAQNH
ncbi:MAG TPA: anthrone oxygenase family protein [Mucilaginibacter sp.]|jgi:uncharacterized protein YybS (DUF2232 family)